MCKRGYPIFTTRIMAESHLQRCGQIACFLSRAAPLHPSSKEKVKNCARANPATLRMQAR